MKSGIRIEALDTLPADVRRTILHAIAEAAAYGVALRIATPSPARVEAAKLAGQASARARAERFGSPNPRANTGTEREPNVNGLGTERERKRERIVNGSFTAPPVSPEPFGSRLVHETRSNEGGRGESLSQISDLRSEDQRESAREARAEKPKAPKAPKPPKPEAWRRVPAAWQPTEQHRQIAAGCGVPFDLELAKFRDHEFSTPKRDPDATFRNWLRNARPARSSFPALPPPPAPKAHATRTDIDRMLGLA